MHESAEYLCPHCQQPVSILPGQIGFIQCPACGTEFILPDQPGDSAAPDDPMQQRRDHRADELDGMRIRQLSQMRRATYRSRSYAIIAACVCAVGAIELVYWAVRESRAIGWGIRPIAYLVLAMGAVYGAVFFAKRATSLHRQAKASALAEPTNPPDFTPLGDGSQQAKNLEDIR